MLLFLEIVGGVLVAILLAALLGWWLLKRWLKRKMGDWAVSAALLDDLHDEPVRLHLQLVESEAAEPVFAARWAEAHKLGFRKLADFGCRDGETSLICAAAHESLPCALALVRQDDSVSATFLALDEDLCLFALSEGPGKTLVQPKIKWQVVPEKPLYIAFEQIQQECQGRALRHIDVRLFRIIWEGAHASRQDALLAFPPSRADLDKRAAAQSKPPTPRQIEQAWEMQLSRWQERVAEAAIDHYRRESRIDAESWERMRDDLHVVHGHLSAESIRDLLVAEEGETELWQQLQAQGLRGVSLYEALAERLPAVRRRRMLLEVRRPLLARIYGPSDERSDAPSAQPHFYQARDTDGKAVQGAVLARSSGEAKSQLAAQGLGDVRIAIEPTPLSKTPDFMLDPQIAAMATRGVREGLGMGLLRAAQGNLWIWLPPTLWVAWSLYRGAPFGWADYLGFAYLVVALLVVLALVAPIVLYNQLLNCRLHARWRSARLCLALLARLNPFGGLDRDQLVLEKAKISAAEGNLTSALQNWEDGAHGRTELQHQTGVVQIYDAAGRFDEVIATQRKVLGLQPTDLNRIDLAMSLARTTEHVGEAEELIAGIDPQALSELALAGYQYARGLIADQRGQPAQALHHFTQAIEQAGQFKSNPLILGLLAEINGYSALALKRAGERDRADSLWQQVRPLLAKQASSHRLIQQYDRAG